MNLNESSLRHPRTQWAIEAACWRAIELSRVGGIGSAPVKSASGREIMRVTHDRKSGLSFHIAVRDVTDQMRAFLRSLV